MRAGSRDTQGPGEEGRAAVEGGCMERMERRLAVGRVQGLPSPEDVQTVEVGLLAYHLQDQV